MTHPGHQHLTSNIILLHETETDIHETDFDAPRFWTATSYKHLVSREPDQHKKFYT
jgi:hypothetical protein